MFVAVRERVLVENCVTSVLVHGRAWVENCLIGWIFCFKIMRSYTCVPGFGESIYWKRVRSSVCCCEPECVSIIW